MSFRTAFAAIALAASAIAIGPSLPAEAYPPYDLTVINDTDSNMVAFYASSTRSGGWGEDLFGNDVLEPGYRWKRNLADGYGTCVFDLRAVFADGGEVTRWGLNVCTTTWWRVYERRRR